MTTFGKCGQVRLTQSFRGFWQVPIVGKGDRTSSSQCPSPRTWTTCSPRRGTSTTGSSSSNRSPPSPAVPRQLRSNRQNESLSPAPPQRFVSTELPRSRGTHRRFPVRRRDAGGDQRAGGRGRAGCGGHGASGTPANPFWGLGAGKWLMGHDGVSRSHPTRLLISASASPSACPSSALPGAPPPLPRHIPPLPPRPPERFCRPAAFC